MMYTFKVVTAQDKCLKNKRSETEMKERIVREEKD